MIFSAIFTRDYWEWELGVISIIVINSDNNIVRLQTLDKWAVQGSGKQRKLVISE